MLVPKKNTIFTSCKFSLTGQQTKHSISITTKLLIHCPFFKLRPVICVKHKSIQKHVLKRTDCPFKKFIHIYC